MTWSYGGDPANSVIDRVRFLSGDTDTTNQQVSNEEISFLLSENNSDAYLAASGVCEAAASKASGKADYSRSVGDLSISTQYSAHANSLLKLAEVLRMKASRHAPPSVNFYTDDSGNVFGAMKFAVDMDRNYGSYDTRTAVD